MDKIHISSIIVAVSQISNVLDVFFLSGCVADVKKIFLKYVVTSHSSTKGTFRESKTQRKTEQPGGSKNTEDSGAVRKLQLCANRQHQCVRRLTRG